MDKIIWVDFFFPLWLRNKGKKVITHRSGFYFVIRHTLLMVWKGKNLIVFIHTTKFSLFLIM